MRVPLPARGLYGTGHYVCPCVSLAAPSELVQRWLRPGLRLLPQRLTPPGTHPFTLLLGVEDEVYASYVPWFKMDYQEFAVVLPYVGWEEPAGRFPGPFLFTPHLYIDKTLPILIGRLLFGFAKAEARMSWSRQALHIRAADDSPIFQADFGWGEGALPDDAARTVAALLQQPSVSEPRAGRFVCSGFNWALPQARLTPMNIRLSAHQDFLPGSAEALNGREAQGEPRLERGFAFCVETRWTLTGAMSTSYDWGAYVSEAASAGLGAQP